ncbi:MAG: hypothetical protein MJ077_01050 [Oscillospiraceae bacterium]|nr:hypothetical protein [Oscillospiraceae bacterium]
MKEREIERLLIRLERKLELDEQDDDIITVLEDELNDAENELKLYLGLNELPKVMESKIVELAAVFYRRDSSEKSSGLSSSSYSEGQISQSEHYFSPKEYRAAVAEILDGVARYRRVSC